MEWVMMVWNGWQKNTVTVAGRNDMRRVRNDGLEWVAAIFRGILG